METPNLPSVTTFLNPEEQKTSRFLKPQVTTLCGEDNADSPMAKILAIRTFTLLKGETTPVHVHTSDREKFYLVTGMGGTLVVTIIIEGELHVFTKHDGGTIIIPPKCPHFVRCTEGECNVLVVTSSQTNDVVWEADADKLCKNEHLQRWATR